MIARHEQHECDTSAIRWRHECNTNATRMTRVRHKCYKSNTSATRVKSFDFDNETSGNIFPHPYISYIANKRLLVEEQLHFKKYLSVISRFHDIMRLKCAPQK